MDLPHPLPKVTHPDMSVNHPRCHCMLTSSVAHTKKAKPLSSPPGHSAVSIHPHLLSATPCNHFHGWKASQSNCCLVQRLNSSLYLQAPPPQLFKYSCPYSPLLNSNLGAKVNVFTHLLLTRLQTSPGQIKVHRFTDMGWGRGKKGEGEMNGASSMEAYYYM